MKAIVRTLLAAVLVIAAPVAVAAEKPSVAPGGGKGMHETLPADEPVKDDSIYQLESTWLRADGRNIQLKELQGKIRVLAIFYSTCEYACPIIVGRMKSVQKLLGDDAGDDVGFVLVSMDAKHDDPKKLVEYRDRMQLEGDWTLLQGSDGDVRELGALLGFRYREEADGGFSHSNMISVLDREGRLVHQSLGLETAVDDAVTAVKGLLGKK